MNLLKKLISFLLPLCILLALCSQAFAEDGYDSDYFSSRSWDEIIAEFIESHATFKNQACFGYKNLVTGEEHFYNGDKYMFGASVYKLPLNMLYASKIAGGELSWDSQVGGYPLSYAMENSVVWSNNEISGALWHALGNFTQFRDAIAPLVGEEPGVPDEIYYKENYFTARQIIFCLNELYSGGEESYPRILEFMLRAEPERYFRMHPHEFEIAHKYGYLQSSDSHLYINDCGIVFTDEPFAIVAFTDNINRPADVIADYCDLMIAYTEYQGSLCKIPEALTTPDEAEERTDKLSC